MKGAAQFSELTTAGGTMIYACLNGGLMTLYVDQYADIAPHTINGGGLAGRAVGIVDPVTGYPPDANIGTDGIITPTLNPPGYGILRSVYSRSDVGSTELAVRLRQELLTAFAANVCASWGVFGDHADLPGLQATDGIPGTLSVSGATSLDPLSASASVVFQDSFAVNLLEVSAVYSFQNDASALEQVRIKVVVTLTDLGGAGLTGVTYGFALDPNPAIGTGVATTRFFTPTDADAFAVEGTAGFGLHSVGIGVYEGVENVGAIVGYTPTTNETVVCTDFAGEIAIGDTIRMGSGTAADYYENGVFDSSTLNFLTDAAWRAGLASDVGNYAIFVRSPEFDIDPGDTAVFTFYIFTRLDADAPAPPAAGTRTWAYA